MFRIDNYAQSRFNCESRFKGDSMKVQHWNAKESSCLWHRVQSDLLGIRCVYDDVGQALQYTPDTTLHLVHPSLFMEQESNEVVL